MHQQQVGLGDFWEPFKPYDCVILDMANLAEAQKRHPAIAEWQALHKQGLSINQAFNLFVLNEEMR